MASALVAWTAADAHADPRVAACADAAERGQELRAAQKLVEARQSFVACAQRDCPAAVRESCTEWLGELDRRAPALVVRARDDSGRDVRDVVVTLDGERLPASVTSVAFAANPGVHVLRCEAPGHEPASEEVVLREGEPLRVVSVTMHSASASASSGGSAGAGAGAGVIGPPAPERPFPVVPVSLGAVSLVAFGVFGIVGATAASDYRALDRECAPDCTSDRVDSVRTRFLVAAVALVVGIASGVAAAAVWLFDRPATSGTRARVTAGARR